MSPLRPIVLWVILGALTVLTLVGCVAPEASSGLHTLSGIPADSTAFALAPTSDISPFAPTPLSTPKPPVPGIPTPSPDCLGPNTHTYENEVLGAVIAYPGGYEIVEDEYLSDEYGFSLVAADRNPIFDVEWRRLNAAADVARVVDEELRADAGLPVGQAQTEVDGRPATILSGVPGEVANTVLYVPVGERLYALRYYAEAVDELGACLIGTIRFITPTRSLEDLDLTPAAEALYPLPGTEEALLATVTATAATVEAQPVTLVAELDPPPTPITLADVSADWSSVELPEFGVRLYLPSDWEMSRNEGAAFFAPPGASGPPPLTVGLKGNTPAEPEAMTQALSDEWAGLTPLAFYSTPVTVGGVEGAAFWNVSPYTCADVYVAAQGSVRQISLSSIFCNPARDRLNEVGLKILESVEFFPPE